MRFYLTGHRTFENRGCEALVRSTVGIVRKNFTNSEFYVPSTNIERDKFYWPDAEKSGVKFVKAYFPTYSRYWSHIQRLPFPFLKRAAWPFSMPEWLKNDISEVDAILAIGGDNYSLDYRLPSLTIAIDKLALDMNKPVVVWGGSVGPFEDEPLAVPTIKQHLSRTSVIVARESFSEDYLRNTLSLQNVASMADPAFTLAPEYIDHQPFWPANRNGVLGLNISPLIESFNKGNNDIRKSTIDFIRNVVRNHQVGVLLIPHVMPLNNARNNDEHYMLEMMNVLSELKDHVKMMPATLNAAKIKHVISKLRFFIGARTHATIAALSSCVPTISIGYSVKSRGINIDIFGNLDSVLDTSLLSNESLSNGFNWLLLNEREIKAKLERKIPELQKKAFDAVKYITVNPHFSDIN